MHQISDFGLGPSRAKLGWSFGTGVDPSLPPSLPCRFSLPMGLGKILPRKATELLAVPGEGHQPGLTLQAASLVTGRPLRAASCTMPAQEG